MADNRYFLSENDKNLIQQLLAEAGKIRRNPGQRYGPDYSEHQAPETYIVLTPVNGIPGLRRAGDVGTGESEGDTGTAGDASAGDTVQFADCQVHYIKQDGDSTSYTIKAVTGMFLRVFNLSTKKIPGSVWLTVQRDKFGSWLPSTNAGVTDVECVDGQLIVTYG